ncbi:MAG: UvrD-helicase domain-containing protein [Rhodoferax sp.]
MKAAYELNGQRVSAERFYAVACDPGRSVAVEACAGAGKTWMLVSRIVRALLDGVDAHEILAITFTRRAAAEMRLRLHDWLAEFAGAPRETLIRELRDRGVPIAEASQAASKLPERLAHLYQEILASGRPVQVRTFHGWFAALLRSAPLTLLQRLELPASYELLENDALPKALVWRRFYLTLEGDAQGRADFEAVVFEHGRAQTEKALQTALDKRTEFALADAAGVVAASVRHFGAQYPEFSGLQTPEELLHPSSLHWQALLDAARALGNATARTFSAKGVELELALASAQPLAAFDALLTDKGAPRKFSEKIVGIELVRQAQDLALRVLAACRQHKAWLYQQRMARLTALLLKDYAAIKRERGWVDMNDVERAASLLLGDPVLSGWVQERLDARIRHLLIDEFQDTNPLQWQALRSWLSAYAGAGGAAPSVFIVGDPKQSIYRFRRAEPQVFKAAQDFVRAGLGGDLLSCDHTRRNASAVVEIVNAVMTEAVRSDGYGAAYRQHSTGSTLSGRAGRLPVVPRATSAPAGSTFDGDHEAPVGAWRDSLRTARELPEETLRTLEARQAAGWIARHLADTGLPASEVMVLSRRRAALLPLQDELRRLNIAAQIGDKTDLIESCEVQDVVALLDVLVSPQHDLSLARVLRSPFFDLDDAALVQIRLAQLQSGQSWFELLLQSELATPDARVVATHLLRWKAWLDALPPHDALHAIYADGDVLARFAAIAPVHQRETVLANLRALLTVSLQVGGGRYATPYAFVRALKAGGVLAPAAVNRQALRLLTIHGAKGLEADTVMLLDTDASEHKAETMGVLVDWPGEAAWPAKFVFLASESLPPACAVPVLDAERLERQREELNALYVALTRARRVLVVSCVEPYRASGRSWWQRLAGTEMLDDLALDATSAAVAAAPVPGQKQFYLRTLPAAPLTSRPAVVGEDADPVNARIGKAMHRLLEWGELSNANLAAAAREFGLNPQQGTIAAGMAARILQGAAAWAWDAAVLAWSGNETGLMYQGEFRRIDRLVQRRDGAHAGEWWVLDYKSEQSPQHRAELVAQLHGYRLAVQAIYPEQRVRAAFLTAQGGLIELKDHG